MAQHKHQDSTIDISSAEVAKTSLASKLTKVTLLILVLVMGVTVLVVGVMNLKESKKNLADNQELIKEGLKSKGRGLAQNHSLAMKDMVYDNAFTDVESLVYSALREDPDIVYGLFLDAELSPWAYVSPSAPVPPVAVEGVVAEVAKKDPMLWKELGIDTKELAPGPPVLREVHLFGQDIFEFAMPVIADEEFLGVVRYGISAKRMQDSVAVAQVVSDKRLKTQLGVLIAIGFVMSLAGIMVVRYQAVRVTRPLGDLTRAANELASGNRNVRVEVSSGDEVELLAASFNQMVEELKVSYDELEEMNHGLEQRVTERTQELDSRNRDMKKVFENVDQGFVTLNKDGRMAMERSAVVDMWFGSYSESKSFANYMSGTDENFGQMFEFCWESLCDGFLPLELCLEQLPKTLHVAEQSFAIRYSALTSEGQSIEDDEWDGVLVVIEDITEQLAYEREREEQHELGHAIKSIVNDRQGFVDFLTESDTAIQKIIDGEQDDDLALLKRTVHTIKGNTAIFGFNSIAAICHEMENEIEELDSAPSAKYRDALNKRWTSFNDSLAFMMGANETEQITVDAQKISDLLQQLKGAGNEALYNSVFEWQLEDVEVALSRIGDRTRQIARTLGLGDLEIKIDAGALALDGGYWSPFWTELVHVIRNAVDHGLSDFDRDKKGIPSISLSAQEIDDQIVIEVSDNGAGIAWDLVKAKALGVGLPHSCHEDLVSALFQDGMTTKEEVSETSGRGVGMAAVKYQVSEMGGRIAVSSKKDVGTTFSFKFPKEIRCGELST